MRIDGQVAIGLALVIHELATNAAKYGAYSRDGALDLKWSLAQEDESEQVRLTWLERGGPAPKRNGAGFGTRLIEAVVKNDLRGAAHMHFEPEGLRAELIFSPRR